MAQDDDPEGEQGSGAQGEQPEDWLTPEEAERQRQELMLRIAQINRELRQGHTDAAVAEIDRLDPERRAALEDLRQDIGLKKTYAQGLFKLLAAQLAIADAVFVAYAWAGKHWNLPPDVIQVWLAATLVEVVGVVTVVTRYLFPRRDRGGALDDLVDRISGRSDGG